MNGPAHVACGGLQRLGLHGKKSFEAQYSPRRLAVYASRPSSPMIPQHSLPGGRYPLPGPDFHRLDRASFAWRTQTASEAGAGFAVGISDRSSKPMAAAKRLCLPDPQSCGTLARRSAIACFRAHSPPAGVRSGLQGRRATGLLERQGFSGRLTSQKMEPGKPTANPAQHHTCPAFCPRYFR